MQQFLRDVSCVTFAIASFVSTFVIQSLCPSSSPANGYCSGLPTLEDSEALYQAAIESVDVRRPLAPVVSCLTTIATASRAWIEACIAAWQREESYPFFIFDRRNRSCWAVAG